VSIIPLGEARPGFNAEYQLQFSNTGTVLISGIISLFFDPVKLTFTTSDVAPDNETEDTVAFNYTNLEPFETKTITLAYLIAQPPVAQMDDVLMFTASITPTAGDATIEDNTMVFNQTIVNSFDPNDKIVVEGERLHIDDLGKDLHYIIRFQNTGSAAAINVRVEDILDDTLDAATFEPVSFSHDAVTRRIDNSLEFRFDGINLPPQSAGEEASQGYIIFKVTPKQTLVVGDIITGSAAIFFDFNAPIITNTTTTEIVTNELPVANDDIATLPEGTSIDLSLILNDIDGDGSLDTSSINIMMMPNNGAISIHNDGTINYTHDGSETLEDFIRYTINDNEAGTSNIAVVYLTISPVNDAPIAADDSYTINEGDTGILTVSANDMDIDGTLNLASIIIIADPIHGMATVHTNGTISYTHDGSETTSDFISYTINDNNNEISNTAQIDLSIIAVNDAPIAEDDNYTINEGEITDFAITSNDSDVDGTLDLSSIVIPMPPINGTPTINANGTITYAHDGSKASNDFFTYTLMKIKYQTQHKLTSLLFQ
jgi:uncharacterized repeat protein (TIGR01451 family)